MIFKYIKVAPSVIHDRLPKTYLRCPKETVSRKINENKISQGVSKDSPSLDGTSAIVTRARRGDAPDTPQGLKMKATAKQWIWTTYKGNRIKKCRCKKSHLPHSMVPGILHARQIVISLSRHISPCLHYTIISLIILTCSEYSRLIGFTSHTYYTIRRAT